MFQVEEGFRKIDELPDVFIIYVCPKGLLEGKGGQWIIDIILSVYSIADEEDLYILK